MTFQWFECTIRCTTIHKWSKSGTKGEFISCKNISFGFHSNYKFPSSAILRSLMILSSWYQFGENFSLMFLAKILYFRLLKENHCTLNIYFNYLKLFGWKDSGLVNRSFLIWDSNAIVTIFFIREKMKKIKPTLF